MTSLNVAIALVALCSVYSNLCIENCFDAVGWAAGRASDL